MNPAILALAATILVQAATAIWWASRLSMQLEALTAIVSKARIDLSAVQGIVHSHEIELALLTRPAVSR